MYRKFLFFAIILGFASCTTSRISTTNLHDLTSFEQGGDIYALPQTRLMYTVTAVKMKFTPGPFCDYSKKYLGLSEVLTLPKTKWQIEDIDLCQMTEPDPDHFYSIKTTGFPNFENELEAFQRDGLILQPASLKGYQVDYNGKIHPVQEVIHNDLSVKPFFTENASRVIRTGRDTLGLKLPTKTGKLKSKSKDEKAKEAAAFIIKIRKRRFKLLSGQYEVYPEGNALKTGIAELNKLEEKYLSLFIGSVKTDTVTRVYSIVPTSSEKIQRITLFKFSEFNGFEEANSQGGIPVVVDITNLEKSNTLSQLELPVSVSSYSDIVFYRFPDRASIMVNFGSHILHESEMPLYQFGVLIPKYMEPKRKSILSR